MPRAFVLVLDSVGIGGAPDAARYGDAGADTVGHIAEACARGAADRPGLRTGPLALPNLARLGLGEACRLATGRVPPGLADGGTPAGGFGCAAETSRGKDTPSGHWEIAGCPVTFDWGYFPKTMPSFPPDLVAALCREADLPGILGDCHASGTEIIAALGEEHVRTGRPICYTSADSVFQIAAHEEAFGLDRLYAVCRVARRLVDPLTVGRVIARPFTGATRDGFVRTGNRKDLAVPPPAATMLDAAEAAGRDVITVGKIGDIFAHRSTGREWPASGNAALLDRTLDGADALADGGLLFANFIDFDSLYGHRRDVAGYAAALEAFDRRLPELFARLRTGDLVVITADHGCDPTWPGTDHTREQVPVLTYGAGTAPLGRMPSYAAIAAMVTRHLAIGWRPAI
ncbi:phosphopentomutase [Rhodoplanes sp. TEM]|uniref:Phosphopentomutase n=1 Tax=Rhodoplanes tepidamans TaxID=200616 RepID=A0ABT5J764_RHOTP|nr:MULTISPECIES: phosphopentomutase [Rhodoplanes]MDC7785485.1 phosphopentomutase [Rhodoplanes tepidamans]MDC7987332.1 phosphopentomutase [Rhodoplanes sp. TEM]MDQ0353345.1 phosphopentomutase [Rhodoplanes tepidamans]